MGEVARKQPPAPRSGGGRGAPGGGEPALGYGLELGKGDVMAVRVFEGSGTDLRGGWVDLQKVHLRFQLALQLR